MPHKHYHSKITKLFTLSYVICALFAGQSVYAQHSPWYTGIFAEGAVQNYGTPGLFDGLIDPDLGFRAALGYEYRRFRFALESGYTHITGTNPVALDFAFAPLLFKAGYTLPIYRSLGVQADLGLGRLFSRTVHYASAIDIIRDNKQESSASSFLTGARLYATYTFRPGLVKLYLGGGLDLILETDGPIPLPLFEAGISLKPLMPLRPRVRQPVQGAGEAAPIAPEELVFAHTPENIVIEESEEGRTYRLLNAVYFEANSVTMIERFRPILNEAGVRLRDNPDLTIILRAYSAPFGTVDGQVAISAARAWFCVEYFMRQYGIAEERMKIEYFGAERAPQWRDASWESWRCVELIMQGAESSEQ